MVKENLLKSWDYWDELEKRPSSGIRLARGSIYDTCDRKVNDAERAALNAVKRRLNTYVPELRGILAGFKRLCVPSCEYLPVSGRIQYKLKGKFYVFVPHVDLELEGRIIRVDDSTISCLVYDLFTVNVPKSDSSSAKLWTRLKVDETVKVRVTRVTVDGAEPCISGELLLLRNTNKSESSSTSRSETEKTAELGSSLTEQAYNFCRMLQKSIAQTPIMEPAKRPKSKRKDGSAPTRRSLDDLAFEILNSVSAEKVKSEKLSRKPTISEGSLDEMMGKLLDKVTKEKSSNKRKQGTDQKVPRKRRSRDDTPLEQLTDSIIQNILLEKQPNPGKIQSQKKRLPTCASLDDSVRELLDAFAANEVKTETPKRKKKKLKTATSLEGKVKLNFSKLKRS